MPDLLADAARSIVKRASGTVSRAADDQGARTIARQAARPAIAGDVTAISTQAAARSAAPVASVVPFDVSDTEQTLEGAGRLQSKLDELGWGHDPRSVGLDNGGTFLHYAVAGTETQANAWHDVPLQYLQNGQKGFVLRDVAPGTAIKAAPHVIVKHTADNWYSQAGRTLDNAFAWLTRPGETFQWLTKKAGG